MVAGRSAKVMTDPPPAAVAAAPPHVLCIVGGLDPTIGGPVASFQNIWIALRRAGVPVTGAVLTGKIASAADGAAMARLCAAGVDVMAFRYAPGPSVFRRWGVSLALLLWLPRGIRRFDIVQAHGPWMMSSVAALLACRLTGVPFVLVPHGGLGDDDVTRGASRLRIAAKRRLRRLYGRLAQAVIFASRLEERISFDAARPRSAVLYHPVLEAEAGVPAHRGLQRPDRLRVGFLGLFSPRKRIESLLEAAAALPEVELDIAGDGPPAYRRALEAAAEVLGLGARVRWRGFIPAADKLPFLDNLDVLVMPSAYENFGMVAAEALCRSVPVVVAEHCGIAEVVADYGCGAVVAPTAEALRTALAALWRDPAALAAASVRAQRAAVEALSFGPYGARLAEFYRTLRRN